MDPQLCDKHGLMYPEDTLMSQTEKSGHRDPLPSSNGGDTGETGFTRSESKNWNSGRIICQEAVFTRPFYCSPGPRKNE